MFRGELARSRRRSARYRSYVLSDASTPRWVASAVPDISWKLRRIAAGNGDASPTLERSPRISAAQVELQQRLHLIAGPMSVHAAALIAMGRQAQEALTPLEPTHTHMPRTIVTEWLSVRSVAQSVYRFFLRLGLSNFRLRLPR